MNSIVLGILLVALFVAFVAWRVRLTKKNNSPSPFDESKGGGGGGGGGSKGGSVQN